VTHGQPAGGPPPRLPGAHQGVPGRRFEQGPSSVGLRRYNAQSMVLEKGRWQVSGGGVFEEALARGLAELALVGVVLLDVPGGSLGLQVAGRGVNVVGRVERDPVQVVEGAFRDLLVAAPDLVDRLGVGGATGQQFRGGVRPPAHQRPRHPSGGKGAGRSSDVAFAYRRRPALYPLWRSSAA
jgi:hypothetical protein